MFLKTLHFPGDLNGKLLGIELGDPADPADAIPGCFPKPLSPVTVGADCTNPRYHHTSLHHSLQYRGKAKGIAIFRR